MGPTKNQSSEKSHRKDHRTDIISTTIDWEQLNRCNIHRRMLKYQQNYLGKRIREFNWDTVILRTTQRTIRVFLFLFNSTFDLPIKEVISLECSRRKIVLSWKMHTSKIWVHEEGFEITHLIQSSCPVEAVVVGSRPPEHYSQTGGNPSSHSFQSRRHWVSWRMSVQRAVEECRRGHRGISCVSALQLQPLQNNKNNGLKSSSFGLIGLQKSTCLHWHLLVIYLKLYTQWRNWEMQL